MTLPDVGALALDSAAVSAGDEVTTADIDDDKLVFTPVAGANGSPYTSFTFTVSDGTDESAAAATMTITVTATTPAPTITAVAVTSTPQLATDTYGVGETIQFTITFSAAVTATGTPQYAFSLGNSGSSVRTTADYDAAASTATTLVFGYTVGMDDEDNNGIFLWDSTDSPPRWCLRPATPSPRPRTPTWPQTSCTAAGANRPATRWTARARWVSRPRPSPPWR